MAQQQPMSKTSINTPFPKQDLDGNNNLEERNRKALRFIHEDVTTNADVVQRRVLTEILTANAKVEYLSTHGLGNGETDRETFKKLVPVTTYEDLAPYIQRIANGDRSPIICNQPISEFLPSSGTIGGKRKLIPGVKDDHERRSMFFSLQMPIMSQFIPGLENGKKMFIHCMKSESTTKCGLPVRTISTSYYKNEMLKNKHFHDPYSKSTSPIETVQCTNSFQSMYSQILCGLCQNMEVLRVGSVFATGFIQAIKLLEDNWQHFCHDIRTGSIDPRITDSNVRESVMKIVKPDSRLAEFIENECGKDSWKGIVSRLWPNVKYIDVVVTGSMSVYIPTLDYYGNGLPLVCGGYGSSECCFGLNLNPLCKPSEVAYTFIPTMAYFEFMRVNKDGGNEEEDRELVDLVDVELGKEYEVVVTTYSGLYRYIVGDIVRVVGFKNKAPQFYFVGRKNVLLSIDVEKIDEAELQNAINNAVRHHLASNATLQDYTSYADTSSIPGHYILFWEINYPKFATQIPVIDLESCCLTIEESLNSVYRQCRTSFMSIGPLEIRVVKNGTFAKLIEYAINLGASMNQYKTPRCVKEEPVLELLNSNVISRHLSPTYPKWISGHKIME